MVEFAPKPFPIEQSTQSLFARVGIDPSRVNPKPLGEGLNHIVYSMQDERGAKKVVKVPRKETKGLMHSSVWDETENVAIVKKFFGSYAVPTEVRPDPTGESYVIVQDKIDGVPVTSHTQSTGIRAQISDIMRLNREMMRQTGRSLDFLGVPGTLDWIRHQSAKVFDKNSEFSISNLMVDRTGNVHIIDNDTFIFDHVPVVQKVTSRVSFFVNRFLIHWYFGVDMKGT
jgi:hypothetical protein